MCLPAQAASVLEVAANMLMAGQGQPPAAPTALPQQPAAWPQGPAAQPPAGTEAPTLIQGRMWLPLPLQANPDPVPPAIQQSTQWLWQVAWSLRNSVLDLPLEPTRPWMLLSKRVLRPPDPPGS